MFNKVFYKFNKETGLAVDMLSHLVHEDTRFEQSGYLREATQQEIADWMDLNKETAIYAMRSRVGPRDEMDDDPGEIPHSLTEANLYKLTDPEHALFIEVNERVHKDVLQQVDSPYINRRYPFDHLDLIVYSHKYESIFDSVQNEILYMIASLDVDRSTYVNFAWRRKQVYLEMLEDSGISTDVKQVMMSAVLDGDAKLLLRDGVLVYHEPSYSGIDHPVTSFRYSKELGLHLV